MNSAIKLNSHHLIFLLLWGWMANIWSFINIGEHSLTLWLLLSFLMAIYVANNLRNISNHLIVVIYFFLLSFLCGIVADMGIHTLSSIVQQTMALIFLLAAYCINWKVHFKYFCNVYKVVFFVAFIYAVYQFIARVFALPLAYLPVTNLQIGADEGFQRGYSFAHVGFDRVSSFFIEPSVYARFNTGFFSLVLAGAFPKKQMLYIITVFISIFISASGTAVVVILSLLMLFLIMNGSVSNYIKYIALTVVVLTGVFLVAPERMLGLISHAFSSDYETQRRFASLSNNINTIMEQPYFGYGIGNALKFAPDGIYNSFVFLSMERGLVGLLFFLSTFLYVVLNLIPVCRTNVIFRFLLFMLFAEFLFLGSEAAVYFPYTYFIVGVALQALIKDKYYSYYS